VTPGPGGSGSARGDERGLEAPLRASRRRAEVPLAVAVRLVPRDLRELAAEAVGRDLEVLAHVPDADVDADVDLCSANDRALDTVHLAVLMCERTELSFGRTRSSLEGHRVAALLSSVDVRFHASPFVSGTGIAVNILLKYSNYNIPS